MSSQLCINSHRGPYKVDFVDSIEGSPPPSCEGYHILIDEKVLGMHRQRLKSLLEPAKSIVPITALEESKALENMPELIARLTTSGVRRNQTLLAIGGGIIQDISCFLATNLFRGLKWSFYPTTLLAQADSCVGSKSSINCLSFKNLLGSFCPPQQVIIDPNFTSTLSSLDIKSGIGEMLKVHAIAGSKAIAEIVKDYPRIVDETKTRKTYTYRSLAIKKPYVEEDEFDRGARNIFNYGHSFGHALEAATHFAIPHGIAVTIGMDLANFLAFNYDVAPRSFFAALHPCLATNYVDYSKTVISVDAMLTALHYDKKNSSAGQFTLIVPGKSGEIHKRNFALTSKFRDVCAQYFAAYFPRSSA